MKGSSLTHVLTNPVVITGVVVLLLGAMAVYAGDTVTIEESDGIKFKIEPSPHSWKVTIMWTDDDGPQVIDGIETRDEAKAAAKTQITYGLARGRS